MSKCDPDLGRKVHAHLVSLGLETPMVEGRRPAFVQDPKFAKEQQISDITKHMKEILGIIGVDQTDETYADTAKRVAQMYVNEVFWGLDYDRFPKMMSFAMNDHENYRPSMVVQKQITIKSGCGHHLVVIEGLAWVGYIPGKKNIGLSKINKICEFFARRPTEQERMTEQIRATLQYILGTDDVIVVVSGKHHCVTWRGVEHEMSQMSTSSQGGAFITNPAMVQEFHNLCSLNYKM